MQYVTHNCNEITARALQLDMPNAVAEIYLIQARKEDGTWKVATVRAEFNGAAGAANIAAAEGA